MAGRVRVWHELHHDAIRDLLTSPNGPVAADLLRRGLRVETRAKQNLEGGSSGPKRIDTGRLRASITTTLVLVNGGPAVRVGTSVEYALMVHEGTGLWGPSHAPIRPRRARFLVFSPDGGEVVFARQVSGMRPNRFLVEAIPAARD